MYLCDVGTCHGLDILFKRVLYCQIARGKEGVAGEVSAVRRGYKQHASLWRDGLGQAWVPPAAFGGVVLCLVGDFLVFLFVCVYGCFVVFAVFMW